MIRLLSSLLVLFSFSMLTLANEGEASYQTCSACHGPAAEGNEALASPQLAGQSYACLKEQIINFRNGYRGNAGDDIHGQVMMASAQGLTDEAIEALSTYLSKLPSHAYASTTDGDALKGSVFYKENCSDCHGGRAQGIATLFAPNLTVIQDWYIRAQTRAYQSGWRGHSQSTTRAKHMRSMAGVFSTEQELEDVISWLDTLN